MDVLNVGSGGRCHDEWTNLDLKGAISFRWHRARQSLPVNFVRHRLPAALPFEAGSFDAIYCAQVIEHFSRSDAATVLAEFRRVLRVGGVARIVVPDLEAQCHVYLDALQARSNGDDASHERYEFAKLWLLDQFARTSPGGELTEFSASAKDVGLRREFRLSRAEPSRVMKRAPRSVRGWKVRRNGELHRWAYDRSDLSEAAARAGFSTVELVTFDRSKVDAFTDFDRDAAGEIQPGSLYAEMFA